MKARVNVAAIIAKRRIEVEKIKKKKRSTY